MSKTKPKSAPARSKPSATGPKLKPSSGVAEVLSTVHAKAKILSEALPYMQRYDRKTVVVKFGGHAMGDAELAKRPAAFPQVIVTSARMGEGVKELRGAVAQLANPIVP